MLESRNTVKKDYIRVEDNILSLFYFLFIFLFLNLKSEISIICNYHIFVIYHNYSYILHRKI